MPDFDAFLSEQLESIEAAGLRRQLRVSDTAQGARLRLDGRELINFSSNDYLGLAAHPELVEAGRRALEQFGLGAGAARLICGSQRPHYQLEEGLADFKGTEAALSFSTGYAAAVGAITALVGKGDVVILDKFVHASIVDGARLSGALIRVYPHNDLNALEKRLKWAAEKHPKARKLVVTESVFSMDGDLAPLLNIAELKERHGAWLMVDEAHATGLYGRQRAGLVEEYGLRDRVELQLVTLGKALGCAGGAICGRRALIDLLINRARPFIYSTAPPPSIAAAASCAVELLRGPEGESRRQRLWAMVEHLKTTLIQSGHAPGIVRSPIVPLILGGEARATETADQLREAGLYVPAIRYPTVSKGQARLRFAISADHTLDDLEALSSALRKLSTEQTADEPLGQA